MAFEDELSGRTGKVRGTRDARGRSLLLQGAPESLERQGATVTLTLDRQIQYAAEKALDRAVEESRATAGMLVVLDPRSGELLAMAQSPRFNPNNPVGLSPKELRDRPALDLFEPGSTYKAFVAAEALENGLLRLEETFDCENGAWEVGKYVIHDTHPHGQLNLGRISPSPRTSGQRVRSGWAAGDMRASRRFSWRAPASASRGGRGSAPSPRPTCGWPRAFGQGRATAVRWRLPFGALAAGLLMRPYLVARVTDPAGW